MRHRGYAAINIAGLAVGIAACLLLFLVLTYELSFDTFHRNAKNIYHVVTVNKYADGQTYNPGIAMPALEALRADFSQMKISPVAANYGSQVAVMGTDSSAINSNKKFIEDIGVFFLEPQFFDLFDYKWLSGSPAVLAEPNNVVLTKTIAEKYFTNWEDAAGKFIKLDNALNLRVAGVLADPPNNTDLPLRVITSFITYKNNPDLYGYNTSWGSVSSNFQVYMLAPPNSNVKNLDAQLKTFSDKHYPKSAHTTKLNFVQPLKDLHFDTRFENFGEQVTNKTTLWTLGGIGVLIIIMACINFINLSTAQAVGRSKEVGVRKVLGGTRSQLLWQMMGETAVIVMIAIALAIIIALIAVPYLKYFISLKGNLSLFTTGSIIFLVIVAILVTLLSGFYPSLILSGFKPALALKNKINSTSVGGISLRRGLVVLQFAISQVLIIGTIAAISQMNFIRKADLGFQKEAVLVLDGVTDSVVIARQPSFKAVLLNIPGIESVSFSSDPPSSDNSWSSNFAFNGGEDEKFEIYRKYGDEDYFKTYGLQLLAGRTYSKSDTSREIVVNETLLKKLGIKNPGDIIGKTIKMGGGVALPIVGVVKDFKNNSLRDNIKPTLISTSNDTYTATAVKLKSSNIPETQQRIQSAWDKYFPEYVNSSSFMDERIAKFYAQEEKLSLLYKIFAGLAIFISCLGLFGLVSFMAVQKTKEVGIRKVLGASVGNIVYLFSREFTVLIVIAFVIAAPLAWYMMNNWLNNFAYRIPLGAGIFVLAVIASIVIAWITVGYKAINAALANPVKSLRSE